MKIELKYEEQDIGFVIDTDTLFTEDRIIPANVSEYPKIMYGEVKDND